MKSAVRCALAAIETELVVPLGAHMSIARGVDRALLRGHQIGCQTIQIFTKSNHRWAAPPLEDEIIERWYRNQDETGIAPVVAHDSYLINLASPDDELWQRSLDAFVVEMERCEILNLPYLVMHPGSHTGSGEEVGLRRIATALDRAFVRLPEARVKVLLETTAGQGTSLGHRFEHLAQIMALTSAANRLGICFDTCHALAAGYDIRTLEGYEDTFQQFDRVIGLEQLLVFHVNDSKRDLGSRVDRHQHIGQGHVGLGGFRLLLNDPRFRGHPMLLETPKGPDMRDDIENLAILRGLIA
ncbi:MAG: deoxyribonuclease IV [Anaerolineae bacterium]|nr:MAG: deoxyribonuclease IV [Anaerolineae bacterium]